MDEIFRVASVAAWITFAGVSLPAVVRIMVRRARYYDPVWGIMFLSALNRLSFLFRVPIELSHATAALIGLSLSAMAFSYQRYDRG